MNLENDILLLLADLHKQATTEHSHYYTAKVITKAIQEIANLRLQLSGSKISSKESTK